MVDYPHGNAKKTNSAYFAIAPSVRKDIANRSKSAMPTAIINSYKSSPTSYTINEDGHKDINPVLTPRNKSQVKAFLFLLSWCGTTTTVFLKYGLKCQELLLVINCNCTINEIK